MVTALFLQIFQPHSPYVVDLEERAEWHHSLMAWANSSVDGDIEYLHEAVEAVKMPLLYRIFPGDDVQPGPMWCKPRGQPSLHNQMEYYINLHGVLLPATGISKTLSHCPLRRQSAP